MTDESVLQVDKNRGAPVSKEEQIWDRVTSQVAQEHGIVKTVWEIIDRGQNQIVETKREAQQQPDAQKTPTVKTRKRNPSLRVVLDQQERRNQKGAENEKDVDADPAVTL